MIDIILKRRDLLRLHINKLEGPSSECSTTPTLDYICNAKLLAEFFFLVGLFIFHFIDIIIILFN